MQSQIDWNWDAFENFPRSFNYANCRVPTRPQIGLKAKFLEISISQRDLEVPAADKFLERDYTFSCLKILAMLLRQQPSLISLHFSLHFRVNLCQRFVVHATSAGEHDELIPTACPEARDLRGHSLNSHFVCCYGVGQFRDKKTERRSYSRGKQISPRLSLRVSLINFMLFSLLASEIGQAYRGS